MCKVAHARKRNRVSRLDKRLQVGSYPRFIHLCKFWSRSVKGSMGISKRRKVKGSKGARAAVPHLYGTGARHVVNAALDRLLEICTGRAQCSTSGPGSKIRPAWAVDQLFTLLVWRNGPIFANEKPSFKPFVLQSTLYFVIVLYKRCAKWHSFPIPFEWLP